MPTVHFSISAFFLPAILCVSVPYQYFFLLSRCGTEGGGGGGRRGCGVRVFDGAGMFGEGCRGCVWSFGWK